jgi:hypothetical protein
MVEHKTLLLEKREVEADMFIRNIAGDEYARTLSMCWADPRRHAIFLSIAVRSQFFRVL